MGKIRWKLYLTNFLIGAGLYNSIEVLYLKNHNVSSYLVAFLVLFIPICTAVLEIPTGIIGDYVGRVSIYKMTFLSFFIGMMIVFLASNIYMFFIGYFFEALGWSFYSGNSESLLYESCKRENIDVSKAISSFYSTLTAGYVVSGLLAFLLTNIIKAPVIQVAIVGTIILRFIALGVAMTTSKKYDSKMEKGPQKILRTSISLVLKDKLIVLICLYDALGRLQYFLPVLYQPLLVKLGVRVEYIALIYSISQLFQVIAQKKSVGIINKYGYNKVMAVVPIIQAAAIFSLLTRNAISIVIGIVIIFAGISIKGQCTSLIKHEVATNDVRATFLSLMSLLTLIINSLYLNGIGLLNEKDMNLATIVLGVTLLVLSEMVLLPINSKVKKREMVGA